MASTRRRRWYDDACGAAHGLELLGERWALLVVRELMFGPRRFGALKAELAGISANVLTQRLEGLEVAGIVKRGRLAPPASTAAYELTAWGYESAPIFEVLGRWAARSPAHDPSLPFSAASLMLSLRTMFDGARASDVRATIGFRLGEDGFRVAIAGGELDARRADPAGADAILTADPRTIAGVIYGDLALEEAQAEGVLEVAGDRGLVERFNHAVSAAGKGRGVTLRLARAVAPPRQPAKRPKPPVAGGSADPPS